MQLERMRAVMKYLLPRKVSTLLALPLALAVAPLCEACPVDAATTIRASKASHGAGHACCEKKPQVKQSHTAGHCDHCVAKPATANAAPKLQAEFHCAPKSDPALANSTPVIRSAPPRSGADFPSHSPPAVYLIQQKILL